jgi:hypothetical protein
MIIPKNCIAVWAVKHRKILERNGSNLIWGLSPQTPGVYRLGAIRMAKEKGHAISMAHPYWLLPQCSGRSPALPYPLGRHLKSSRENGAQQPFSETRKNLTQTGKNEILKST